MHRPLEIKPPRCRACHASYSAPHTDPHPCTGGRSEETRKRVLAARRRKHGVLRVLGVLLLLLLLRVLLLRVRLHVLVALRAGVWIRVLGLGRGGVGALG